MSVVHVGFLFIQAEKNAVKHKRLRQELENLEDKKKIVQINIEATKLKVLLSIA
jgi:hypothetical protein